MEQESDDLRSLSTSWGDKPDDPPQDISFRGQATIKNLYIDVERDQWDDDLAKQPVRDLRKNKRFAELRTEPWKLALAVLMVRFARSSDLSSDTWPYVRFEHKLNMGGTPIPHELDVPQAIAIVSDDLRRLAPATANTMAWYEANIERPLAQRVTQTRFGASHLDDEQIGTWLRGRATDVDLEHFSVPAMDIGRAPSVLARWRDDCEREFRTEAGAHGTTRVDDAATHLTLASRLEALVTAQALASALADDVAGLADFREWIRYLSEGQDGFGLEGESAIIGQTVIDAALETGLVPPDSPGFMRHCRLAALLYLNALGIRVG